jgi:hypothetical protein
MIIPTSFILLLSYLFLINNLNIIITLLSWLFFSLRNGKIFLIKNSLSGEAVIKLIIIPQTFPIL